MTDETKTEGNYAPEALAQEYSGESPTLTMDDLYQSEIDHDESAKVTAQLLPASGTWVSNPAEYEVRVTLEYDDDGRRKVGLNALMQHKKTGAKSFIRARMSPDKRFKLDEDGHPTDQYDFLTKVWVSAENAYRSAFGESPANDGVVVDYLTKYPVAFIGRQIGVPTKSNPQPTGEPGFLVFSVAAVRA